MGQRTQIIIRIPPRYINEGNPNNRQERWLVFHNQWLYGYGFLKYVYEIMRGIKEYKQYILNSDGVWDKPEQIDFYEVLIKVIHWANHKDLLDQKGTHRYFNKENEDDAPIIKKYFDWKHFLTSLDNNNGYALIYIDNKGNPKWDILNGFEDAQIISRRTPMEYYRLFYPEETSEKMRELEANFTNFERTSIFSYDLWADEKRDYFSLMNKLNNLGYTTLKYDDFIRIDFGDGKHLLDYDNKNRVEFLEFSFSNVKVIERKDFVNFSEVWDYMKEIITEKRWYE